MNRFRPTWPLAAAALLLPLSALAQAPAAVPPTAAQPPATPQPATPQLGAPQPAAPGATPAAPAAPKTPALLPSEQLFAILGNAKFVPWRGGMLFAPEDNTLIARLIGMAKSGDTEGALALVGVHVDEQTAKGGTTPNGTPPPPPPPDVPMFYLSSILYHGNGDWALWLNNQRFTSRKPVSADGNVEVVQVSPEMATFSWSPIQYSQMQKTLLKPSDAAPRSTDIDWRQQVELKPEEHRILFTLRPNQSFFTQAPRIAEGLPFRDPAVLGTLPDTTQFTPRATPVRKAVPAGAAPATEGAAANDPSAQAPVSHVPPTLPQNPTYKDIGKMLDQSPPPSK